ncbi:MAG: nucleotidyltransferase family protein [Polyangia bacterium]
MLLGLPPAVRARRELSPLIYATLARAGRLDALEPDTARAARRAYLGQVARNSRILERAAELLDGAAARGLTLLPLKGALFASALYPDPGERPMSDLDLLVRPVELDRACALFGELGLRRHFPPRARFTPRHGHDVAFTDERDGLLIELHYRLFHELAGDASVDRLFDRAIVAFALGARRPVPAWADHLFAVLVHAATHAFGDQPGWPFDVALLCAHTTLDEAIAEADLRGYGVAARQAARIAARLLPSLITMPPEGGRQALRARLIDLAVGKEPLAHPPARLRSLVARALLTDDPRDAAREIARKLELRRVEAGERWRRARGRG